MYPFHCCCILEEGRRLWYEPVNDHETKTVLSGKTRKSKTWIEVKNEKFWSDLLSTHFRCIRSKIGAVDLTRTVSEKHSPHVPQYRLFLCQFTGEEPVFRQNHENVCFEKITTFLLHVDRHQRAQQIFVAVL